ncbi:MAG: hypothetical protein ACK55Z_04240, partial [bacterium]
GVALALGGFEEVVLQHPRGLLDKFNLLFAALGALARDGKSRHLFDLVNETFQFHVDVDLACGLGAILDLGCHPVIGQLGGLVARTGCLEDPATFDRLILVEDLKGHHGRLFDCALFLFGYVQPCIQGGLKGRQRDGLGRANGDCYCGLLCHFSLLSDRVTRFPGMQCVIALHDHLTVLRVSGSLRCHSVICRRGQTRRESALIPVPGNKKPRDVLRG